MSDTSLSLLAQTTVAYFAVNSTCTARLCCDVSMKKLSLLQSHWYSQCAPVQ